MESSESPNPLKRTYEDGGDPDSAPAPPPRPKRPKSSKACNACRKQKSRCERLAGESDACHRCGVIGIACIFDSEPLSSDGTKTRKPRTILPRSPTDKTSERPAERSTTPSLNVSLPIRRLPDNAGLHVLANTTEMLSRGSNLTTPSSTSGQDATSTRPATTTSLGTRTTTAPKTTLSPETLSTVESALFPPPRDHTSESESARFRADWRRWVAPLTLLQSLVRRNREVGRPLAANLPQPARPAEAGAITPAQETHLKNHFRLRYLPWLPAVHLARNNAPKCLDNVSPFLTAVICATASRTLNNISAASMEHLRSIALNHLGQVFANPSSHQIIDTLYGFIILVLWPLDPADDVALLINGAKQLASSYERARTSSGGTSHSASQSGKQEADLDHTRLCFAIGASETILSLGAGSTTPPPALEDLLFSLGTASELALRAGCLSDILLILQTSLHKIVASAMAEKGFSPALKDTRPLLSGREPLLHYISTVHMFLTRLGEWEIEFYSISSECETSDPLAVHYAALEIEFHYLRLMLVTHCVLILCHAYPLTSASDETKFALWSWSITGNKSAHSIVRLFNTFSRGSAPGDNDAGLPPLAAAPDRIFAMVVVAIMLILRHQVAAYEYGRRRGLAEAPPAGFTKQAENAIRRTVERMGNIGSAMNTSEGAQGAAEHPAVRYVEILEALLRIWEEMRAQKVASVAAPAINDLHPECSGRRDGGAALLPPHEQLHDGLADNLGSMPMDIDLSLIGGDLFSDAAFPWDSMATLDWGGVGQ